MVALVVDDGSMYAYRDGGGLTSATALSGISTEPEFTSAGGRIGQPETRSLRCIEARCSLRWCSTATALTESELDALATRFREGSYS